MPHRVDAASIRAVLEGATWPSMDAATLQASITGEMPDDLREAMRRDLLTPGTNAHVDAVTCAAMRHHGINPAVVSAMCIHATDVSVNDERGLEIVSMGAEGLSRVRLGRDPVGAAWRTAGGYLENLPVIVPDTLSTSSVGLPVSTILSHPAIDQLDLRIGDVGQLEWGAYVRVREFGWIEGEALAALLNTEGRPCD